MQREMVCDSTFDGPYRTVYNTCHLMSLKAADIGSWTMLGIPDVDSRHGYKLLMIQNDTDPIRDNTVLCFQRC